jgi:hypothetical protein
VSDDYVYVGSGPAATGGEGGWSMRADLYARCVRCEQFMSLNPEEYDNCACGAIYKDVDAGRFGSSLGDNAIEIYRKASVSR